MSYSFPQILKLCATNVIQDKFLYLLLSRIYMKNKSYKHGVYWSVSRLCLKGISVFNQTLCGQTTGLFGMWGKWAREGSRKEVRGQRVKMGGVSLGVGLSSH